MRLLCLAAALVACESSANASDDLTALDLICMGMLGVSTTTSTTPWFVSGAADDLALERLKFRAAVRRDGWQMAQDFQSWLVTRLLVILFSLSFGTPLVVFLAYHFCSLCKKMLLGVRCLQRYKWYD